LGLTPISTSITTILNKKPMPNLNNQKIAIVHDYFGQYGGAEKVVEVWLEMYPEAIIYTSYIIPEKLKFSEPITKAWKEGRVVTTPIQAIFRIKWMQKFQKHLFWVYSILMSFITVTNADVVLISSTHCGKNVSIGNSTSNQVPKIIHYCHSPTRFLHGFVTERDHKSLNYIFQFSIPFFTFWLKIMDLNAAKYLTKKGAIWVGNSKFICSLIKQVYNVDSILIYPPTDIQKFFNIQPTQPLSNNLYYLCHGRISFHKRLDLAIQACLELGIPLKIGGTSALPKEMADLKSLVASFESKNPNSAGLIEFLGRTSDEQYLYLLENCKGFLFPGKEDAGITPIEVFASGIPVIAYQAGGALEYLQNGINGVFFKDQTVDSLKSGILEYQELLSKSNFSSTKIKETAHPFSQKIFENKITDLVQK
jgi:glycosyltransferase involved in cell wall biosynthesis